MEPKARIQETAFEMFTGVGYTAVTMDQIAHRCGIGKATLYKHFDSKEALLLSCIDYFTAQIGAAVDQIIRDPHRTPQQKITDFIVPVLQFVARINVHVLQDIQRNAPEAYARINNNRKQMIWFNIVRIVDEGKEKGVLRPDLNSELVAHTLIGAITYISDPQVLAGIGLPMEQTFRMILSIIWEGCMEEKTKL